MCPQGGVAVSSGLPIVSPARMRPGADVAGARRGRRRRRRSLAPHHRPTSGPDGVGASSSGPSSAEALPAGGPRLRRARRDRRVVRRRMRRASGRGRRSTRRIHPNSRRTHERGRSIVAVIGANGDNDTGGTSADTSAAIPRRRASCSSAPRSGTRAGSMRRKARATAPRRRCSDGGSATPDTRRSGPEREPRRHRQARWTTGAKSPPARHVPSPSIAGGWWRTTPRAASSCSRSLSPTCTASATLSCKDVSSHTDIP